MGSRRNFIQKSSLAALGFAGIQKGLTTSRIVIQKDTNLDNIRKSLGLDKKLVYMNTGSLGPSPAWLLKKEFELLQELELNPVNNNWGPLGKAMEEVRAKAAAFLKCDPDEIVLTRNTTEGLSMVSSTLNLNPGDEILTTNHEHGGGETGLKYAAKFHGAKIIKVDLPMPAKDKKQVISTIIGGITPKTRVLMLSHVTTIEGMRMPLAEISEVIKGQNIFFIVDGAQSAGMLNIDVKALGVDVFAASGHKWLMGPKETGLLYVKKEKQEKIKPVFTSSGYQSYSASSGTRNVAHQIAFGEMIDWHVAVGQDKIENRGLKLGQYCYEKLSQLNNVRVISPEDPDLRSALISIESLTTPKSKLFSQLKSDGIVVKSLPKYNALRFSNHVFNTKEDVDRLIDSLKKYL